MKLNTILLILIFAFHLFGCKTKEKSKMNRSTTTIANSDELISSNEVDFELLNKWVEDKSIVAIGESSHGIGEFYSLKSQIVQFLHKELGYEVVLIEGGFGDIGLASMNIKDLSSLELRNETLYGNFRCKEIEPMFAYIKDRSETEDPLFYGGYDAQTSGNYFTSKIDSICRHLKLNMDLKLIFDNYYKMYRASFETDSTNFIKYRNSFQQAIQTIEKSIEKERDELSKTMHLSHTELDILLRNLNLQYEAVNYSFANKMNEENMHEAILIRDKLMAENVQWIIKNQYPNKKIILWGYNGHIQKGPANGYQATKMMGQHLKKTFGDSYFSIGLFAYEGKAYQHWTKESIDFKNSDSTSIEFKMKRDSFQYTFQKFQSKDVDHWVNQELSALEIESNGNVSFMPSKRFDAGICIKSVGIPTFENEE
ncbi:MAG: erythromycin esterase family protein [Saprospiraceae bacterium]|nr:erythromycin esterase family protein [Saprospiraceae bacterium]